MITKIIHDSVEKKVLADFNNEQYKDQEILKDVGVGKIRNMIDEIKMSLADVRTTEKTNTSSKLQCEAVLRLSIPEHIIQQAIESNKVINNSHKNTADFFEIHYRQDGGSYTSEIAYAVQPTDDKTKIFATLSQTDKVSAPIAELVGLTLLQEPLKEVKKIAEEEEAQQQKEEELRQAELETLEQKAQETELLEWRERHKLAISELNQFYAKLPKQLQNKWESSQKAWNENHKKTCIAESKANSDTPNEEQLHLFMCKTEKLEERLAELKSKKASVIGEIVSETNKKYQVTNQKLKQALNQIPSEILESMGDDYNQWASSLDTKCKKTDDEYDLASTECKISEMNKKIKELEGYSLGR